MASLTTAGTYGNVGEVGAGGPEQGGADHAPANEGLGQAGRVLEELSQGNYAEALFELARPGLELTQLADLRHFLLGQAFFGLRRYIEAAGSYLVASRLPESRFVDSARARRADALKAAGRYARALTAYQRLLHSYPDHPEQPELEAAMAFCLEKMGDAAGAARTLRNIWLTWPLSRTAQQALLDTDRLLASGVVLAPPEPAQIIARARLLRRGWRIDEALAELAALSATPAVSAFELAWEIAQTHARAGAYAEAMAVLRPFGDETATPWENGANQRLRVRLQMADYLSRAGTPDDAVALLSPLLSDPAKDATRPARMALSKMVDILASHARYDAARVALQRLARATPGRNAFEEEMAWLAYRAGRWEDAVAVWEKSQRPFAQYWRARIYERVDALQDAARLYQGILAETPDTYYAMAAQRRLAELYPLAGPVAPGSCPTTPGPNPTLVAQQLGELSAQYNAILPGLTRAHLLWRSGAHDDARRELRLVASEASWATRRGRRPSWQPQPAVYRVWRGAAAPASRPESPRLQQMYAASAVLQPRLAEVLMAAGVDGAGWRLLPPQDMPAALAFPLAYANQVMPVAERFALSPYLLWAIMRTESRYRIDAISPAGARGLMQIMPHTAHRLADELALQAFQPRTLFDPQISLSLAGYYLRLLSEKFNGQVALVAAAYNGGPHNVARWLDARGQNIALDEFIEEIPFAETKRYVKGVTTRLALYERIHCGREITVIPNTVDPVYGPHPHY